MKVIKDIKTWRAIRTKHTGSIGFIPTMGNLHAGHLSLCQRALRDNHLTIVSIFVNPTQFSETTDFQLYPRTLEQDLALLTSQHIDYVFLPHEKLLYPDNYQLQIHELALSKELEGQFRPGHFVGMLTVVLKLLNIIQPTSAYFGEKDFQQLLLIKKMVDALFLPIKIIACPTIRESDGLAMSSRNNRLTPAQRMLAAHFPKILQSSAALEKIISDLQAHGFKVDYVVDKWQRRLAAVWIENIRLIDNISLDE